ncbi:non-hydrolyzing UDP-N-acetylglucosamine 2-epimerase [Maricaulis salignorans]|uniref:UDP-N-acetylglucosamine 2-epimerase (non-hydrolyzing) n=1 Tax=Maricaulis salignorans TaxID=144026 RepID=A0A1G9VNU3_9PROT|nr:UDP-N-acetylglucosamine 2-epimerase (non-hydrolyzing) [Maricaulis salignorans]SDM73849.1 UDP-N-Acetylglucosamine 2-epimerase [Maricaulis salignorans]
MKVSIVAGTRPEVIKLAPVRAALLNTANLEPEWIATGQHGSLADQALQVFGVTPDARLELDWNGKALSSLTSALIRDLGEQFAASRPDFVLVQGDTASAFSGAMAAFLNDIPVGHVEAGLRSGDLRHPFPEEGFRKLISPIADLHFAPTRAAARNLTDEGIASEKVRMTGNTVIDAVQMVGSMEIHPQALDRLRPEERLVLVTLHRRENWDDGVAGVCTAIKLLRNQYPDLRFVIPVHLNPRVRGPIEALLGDEERIDLVEPLAYPAFVAVMKRSHLILSDSGGVQEEAPSFGVPVLVLRDKTERGEAVKAGVARLVGSHTETILTNARQLLDNPRAYRRMSRAANPFGDGHAGRRIAQLVSVFLGAGRKPDAPQAASGLQALRSAVLPVQDATRVKVEA